MPRPYPAGFRARAVALVRAGRPISRVAVELGISEGGQPLSTPTADDPVPRGEFQWSSQFSPQMSVWIS